MPGVAWDPERGFWETLRLTESGCLEWTGMRNARGYGVVKRVAIRRSPLLAHRLAWLLKFGDPGEAVVMHRCDNPACCNPEHLQLGSVADNNADMRDKGRNSPPPVRQWTHCKHGHELSEASRIVGFRADGSRKTGCRECKRARDRERYRATKTL